MGRGEQAAEVFDGNREEAVRDGEEGWSRRVAGQGPDDDETEVVRAPVLYCRGYTMGTYTDLTVAGYPLISSKSEVIPEVMTVFRETDRRTTIRRISERNPLVFGESEDQDLETAVDYTCLTRHAVERLDIMGFGLHRVRYNFEAARQDRLDRYQSLAEGRDSTWLAEELDLFENLTFDDYAQALSVVIAEGLRPTPFDDYDKPGARSNY